MQSRLYGYMHRVSSCRASNGDITNYLPCKSPLYARIAWNPIQITNKTMQITEITGHLQQITVIFVQRTVICLETRKYPVI